jgi:hypothetical protein
MDARRPEEWRITPMDVSDANEWRAIIDQTIDGLQVLWHESEADVPLAVFAVKLEFGKTDVVLALGKSPGLSDAPRPSGIQYIPDSVVVIFDDEVFRSYIAEGDPSWVHTDWEPV